MRVKPTSWIGKTVNYPPPGTSAEQVRLVKVLCHRTSKDDDRNTQISSTIQLISHGESQTVVNCQSIETRWNDRHGEELTVYKFRYKTVNCIHTN